MRFGTRSQGGKVRLLSSADARGRGSFASCGGAPQEVAEDAHGYPRTRHGTMCRSGGRVITTSHAQQQHSATRRGERSACLAQAERRIRGAVCGGLLGSSRGTQPGNKSPRTATVSLRAATEKGVVAVALRLLAWSAVWLSVCALSCRSDIIPSSEPCWVGR